MKTLSGERLASAAGVEVLASGGEGGPSRAVIDSREVAEGDLFVGLPGESFDGGEFGAEALRRGAWGILVATQWGRELAMQRDVGATEEAVEYQALLRVHPDGCRPGGCCTADTGRRTGTAS